MSNLRRTQVVVSLALLLTVAASCGVVALAAHSRRLEAWLTARDVARFRDGTEHMAGRSNRLDYEDRWILEELPGTDRSRGGVYFFGTSTMKWGLASWDIPAELRPLVGNYGVGATNHAMQFQLIRFLVEQNQLLLAGGEKVHVVLGLYWSMGQYWRPQGFFGPLWERYGLYTYDPELGIRRATGSPLLESIKRERARCCSFIGGNLHRLARTISLTLGFRLTETENLQEPAMVRSWAERLAIRADWEVPLAQQMEALGQLADYLAARKVGVTIVLLPQRLPFEDMPMPTAYRQRLGGFCESRGLPFVDLSRLLPEDEFWDMNHSNYAGLMKTHAALMDIARSRLRAMGTIP
jgi:hypothetical protein